MFQRYAIYYTPPPGPLADFGAAWLGWDPVRGEARAHPEANGLDVSAVTRAPRKYGFHGTIKPPFRLAPGSDPAGLALALGDFCAARPPVRIEALRLASLGSFAALLPDGDANALAELAWAAVRDLDRFRAAPTEAELARRRAGGLSPAQDANLRDWGYPYVGDQFRFHMTLTGKLGPEDLARIQTLLAPRLAPILPRPFVIDSLTLCGEGTDGQFHQIERVRLGGPLR